MINETSVRTLERALNILECFSTGKRGLTLNEISKKIDLSPSTTLRFLATLEKRDYIFRDDNGQRYHLGSKLALIGSAAFANMDLAEYARPYLLRLNEQFDETTGLYILVRTQRVCIACIESSQALRSTVQIGNIYPLTRGSSGRVLLAYQPEQVISRLLEEDPFTTTTSLALIREKGYAVSYGVNNTGINGVAAPIFNASGDVIAAVFINGPVTRMSDVRLSGMIELLLEYSKEISNKMGYRNQ